MSFIMLFTCFGTVFAASDSDLTFHITNELDYDEDYVITVPSGTIITVAFNIENNKGEPFTLSTLQNEVYFDKTFFEYAQGATVEFPETECALKEYSDGEQRVFVNLVENADMSANQLVATFKLKVTETTVGASSVIETKSPLVNGTDLGISEKNLTVIIGETPPDTRKYDITYYDNDGSILYVDRAILNGQTTHLNSTLEKEGYVLDGWLINNTPYKKGDEITVNGNIDAYAKWISEIPQTYSVSFVTNGGSFVQAVSGVIGSTIQLTQTPTKSGYSFDGWYLNSNLSGNAVTSVTLSSDITVYAKWSKSESGGAGGAGGGGGGATPQATITFKTTDGIVLETLSRSTGATVELSKYRYHKEGYTFEGWYVDKELTTKIESIKLSENITIFANWVKKEVGKYHPEILTTEHYAYVLGREDGLICPEDNITRAEVATIFFRLLTEDVRKANITRTNSFDDVNDGAWFNTAVSTLAKLEIINGRTETAFQPDANITRAEFTTMAARFSDVVYSGEDLFEDIDDHWAKGYVNAAASIGWVVGDGGKFRPDDNITRAEVMTLVNRILCRIPENKEDLLSGMTIWKDNADENAWYYIAVQEATNSHSYEMKSDTVFEKWIDLTENPDWAEMEN